MREILLSKFLIAIKSLTSLLWFSLYKSMWHILANNLRTNELFSYQPQNGYLLHFKIHCCHYHLFLRLTFVVNNAWTFLRKLELFSLSLFLFLKKKNFGISSKGTSRFFSVVDLIISLFPHFCLHDLAWNLLLCFDLSNIYFNCSYKLENEKSFILDAPRQNLTVLVFGLWL